MKFPSFDTIPDTGYADAFTSSTFRLGLVALTKSVTYLNRLGEIAHSFFLFATSLTSEAGWCSWHDGSS